MNRAQRRAAAAKARRTLQDKNRPRAIVGATCHWRSDGPDGIGLATHFPGNYGNEFARDVHAFAGRLDARDYTPEQAFRGLESLQRAHDWSNPGAAVPAEFARASSMAFTIVYWLETRGHLVSDEHNGVSSIVVRDGVIATVRADEPSTEMVERTSQLRQAFGVDDGRFVDLKTDTDSDLVAELLGESRSRSRPSSSSPTTSCKSRSRT